MGKSKFDGEFDDFEGDVVNYDTYVDQLEKVANNRELSAKLNQKKAASVNEVGVRPQVPPEVLEERKKYRDDLKLALKEVFPDSTGLKPFGDVQNESTEYIQYIMHQGGRLVILEPRGYAKTTRITNLALMCALEGVQLYIIIVASSQTKSQEILEDIRTELTTNEILERLYPATCACFKHLARSPQKTRRQTYGGEFTYIQNSQDTIHFPIIADEPSSGVIIQARPATNLKGLKHKIPGGPNKGKAIRPTLYFFDDPQTEDDASSPATVQKIIKNIKRSALKGGTHQKPVDAVMAVTPAAYGDVAWHFVHQEDSFDLVRYKMLESYPTNMETWYGEYNDIRSNFNKEVRGSRASARKRARQFVLDNWDHLHEGAKVSWEHAYNPGSPLYEVSAVQHAINVLLDDGIEEFEYEYQCNTEYGIYEEEGLLNATKEQILTKVNTLPRRTVPQDANKIVTHIDVNKDVLTYITVACPQHEFRPYIIDKGTWPDQPAKFSKRKLAVPLKGKDPGIDDYRERLYLAVTDLIQFLALIKYKREDGVERGNNVIGVDLRFEESYVSRAVRESPFSNLVLPCWGTYVGPDDDLLHEKSYPEGTMVYENCAEVPNRSFTFHQLKYDTNFFKTEVHKAFNKERIGIAGSLSMYKGEHQDIAEHCNSEYPKSEPGKKSIRHKVQWKAKMAQPDNEYFDNTTACFALLVREGIDINTQGNEDHPAIASREVSGGNVLNQLMSGETAELW